MECTATVRRALASVMVKVIFVTRKSHFLIKLVLQALLPYFGTLIHPNLAVARVITMINNSCGILILRCNGVFCLQPSVCRTQRSLLILITSASINKDKPE
jgi:hypothetical protein